ncbi:MAG: GNAT family N-acetyltransferase [Candidatus Gottesmanbacteria bacterium]|nr:GNAT family N-acetyltransferase [Candidatus Gottesmanbacteria bacterium]
MEFTIRQATEKDFSLIQALNAALFAEDQKNDAALDTHWPVSVAGVEYYMKSLMDSGKIVFIAEDDNNNPVGYIIASMVNKWRYRMVKTGELENMYIVPTARKQGVGRALIEKIKIWLKSRRVERIYVSAYTNNTNAIAFYKANGFAPWETGMEAIL